MLVISAHRLNRSPSQRYRYEQYISFLQQQGFEFTFSPLLSEKADTVFYSKGHVISKAFILLRSVLSRMKDSRHYNDFDIIFIQREALFIGSNFFERKAFHSRAKVIFDFDDSIWLMDTSPGNKKWEWLKNPGKTASNIQHAHAVIAGNAYLKNYAERFSKNVMLIPTTVDCAVHVPKPELRNKETVVIGWSGSISTIKHFEEIVPVLKKLKENYGDRISVKVLGDAAYENSALGIKGKAWGAATEVDDLNTFDIGIMPLPDDEWARGKCGLKGLTFMACGVPVVMSPVGVNTEIVRHNENGFLAAGEDQWIRYLSQLIEAPELRKRLGEAGRQTVVKTYSTEANKEKYLDVFRSLLK
ncbi:MAG: glycosyltransferase family 4 protein [Bacteroidia bacterium]